MAQGYKLFNDDVIYLRKTHFCPDCRTKLEKVPVSKVINSNSPEAENFDFTNGDTFMVGDVRFEWVELECPNCHRHLTVNEMKQIEGVPLAKKPGKLGRILLAVIGVIILIAVALLMNH